MAILYLTIPRGGIHPTRCIRVSRERVRIEWSIGYTINPCLTTVGGRHHRSGFDTDVEPLRVVRVGFDPANVVGIRTSGERPLSRRIEVGESRTFSPCVPAVIRSVDHAWLRPCIDGSIVL